MNCLQISPMNMSSSFHTPFFMQQGIQHNFIGLGSPLNPFLVNPIFNGPFPSLALSSPPKVFAPQYKADFVGFSASQPKRNTTPVKKSPAKLFRPWTDNDEDPSETSEGQTDIQTPEKYQKVTVTQTSKNPLRTENGNKTDLEANSTLETFATNLGRSALGFQCIYCSKIYSRKYGLKIHLRTHTGFKPLKCKICNRPFGDPSNLNKHSRLHSEGHAESYKCELCGKLMIRERDLIRHIHSKHRSGSDCCDSPPNL